MASVTIGQDALSTRRAEIQRLLRPLRAAEDVACEHAHTYSNDVVLAAFDGRKPMTGFREWYFRTSKEAIRAQYYEVWKLQGKMTYALTQAYLHLAKVNQYKRSFDQVLALHCDPYDEFIYKKGPHVHVTCAEHPIPRAHIALRTNAIATTLESKESVTEAMKEAIRMVADEVLDRY